MAIVEGVKRRKHFAFKVVLDSFISHAIGDELIGDTLRSTLAEVTAQALETNTALDLDFACVNVKGDEPSVEVVRQRLAAL